MISVQQGEIFWTRMNADFVVMVRQAHHGRRQAHHERHCILSLSKDQSNDYQDGLVRQDSLEVKFIIKKITFGERN